MKTRFLLLAVLALSAFICASGYMVGAQDQLLTPTATPGPGTQRTDEHGIAQVYVPAGCFLMGLSEQTIAEFRKKIDSSAYTNETPQHQVCITYGYWLDAYEVTNASYWKFVYAGGYTKRAYWSAKGWAWKKSRGIPHDCGSKFNNLQQPRVCITWYEAEAYANWRGGRLPTEAEWEYAARGPDSLIYPWGNTWDSSKTNSAEGNYGRPKRVGINEGDKSWVGAYDMGGNVGEWAADWYDEHYYKQQVRDNPMGPSSGLFRSLRGGSWRYYFNAAYGASRYFESAVYWTDDRGFRIMTPAQ